MVRINATNLPCGAYSFMTQRSTVLITPTGKPNTALPTMSQKVPTMGRPYATLGHAVGGCLRDEIPVDNAYPLDYDETKNEEQDDGDTVTEYAEYTESHALQAALAAIVCLISFYCHWNYLLRRLRGRTTSTQELMNNVIKNSITRAGTATGSALPGGCFAQFGSNCGRNCA